MDPLSYHWMDKLGADEWNLHAVATASAVFFLSVRAAFGEKYGVKWDSFIHASITGIGALVAIYLSVHASSVLTGYEEPFATLKYCQQPLTSLHRILPSILQGYALCDILEGIHLRSKGLGLEFLGHGIATFIVPTIFIEANASHLLTFTLIMELSTIPLGLVKAEFLSAASKLVAMGMFVVLFFLTRIVFFPCIYFKSIVVMRHGYCFPNYLYYISVFFGIFFNALNSFWFYKIVRKVHRKVSGAEDAFHASKE